LQVGDLLGASAPAAQRVFFTCIAAAAALGAVWFASAFARSPVARTAAGIVAVFNPFVLQHVPNPLILWTIAMMGAAGGLVVRAARGRELPPVWLGALSIMGAYLAINPPLLAMVAIWTVGLAGEASMSYDAVDFSSPTAIVLGAEGQGLRRLVREKCDLMASIPMHGHVGSINVSVAAGVVLFEAVRQRRKGKSAAE
jgi:tRNA G18 (ribose-2'-O)-methylase SpoU